MMYSSDPYEYRMDCVLYRDDFEKLSLGPYFDTLEIAKEHLENYMSWEEKRKAHLKAIEDRKRFYYPPDYKPEKK